MRTEYLTSDSNEEVTFQLPNGSKFRVTIRENGILIDKVDFDGYDVMLIKPKASNQIFIS